MFGNNKEKRFVIKEEQGIQFGVIQIVVDTVTDVNYFASLLIELGFSPILISERLGHEEIETTLQTYSHLYPNKQMEVADRLQAL